MRQDNLRGFLERDPANTGLACALLDELIAHAAFEDALGVLSSLPCASRSSPEIRFRAARCALVSGKNEEAIRGYEAMLADGCRQVAIEHDLAYALLCARRSDEALVALRQAIDGHGETLELMVLKARIQSMKGDYRGAIESADSALSFNADDMTASGIKALALFDDGQAEAAEALANRTLQSDPDQYEALLVVSTLLRWRHRIDEAESLYERILRRYPGSGRALSGYGEIAMSRSDFSRAEGLLSAAVEAIPDHIGTWHALAWAQLLQGRGDAAEASYRRAYGVDRNFGDTHGGLALVAVLRGDHDEAEKLIERALRLDVRAMTARCAKALLLEVRGDCESAEKVIAELLLATRAPIQARDFIDKIRSMLSAAQRSQ
jgi:tetratricopeptide (TPR) repeat protein